MKGSNRSCFSVHFANDLFRENVWVTAYERNTEAAVYGWDRKLRYKKKVQNLFKVDQKTPHRRIYDPVKLLWWIKCLIKVFNKDTRTRSTEAALLSFELILNSCLSPGKCHSGVFIISFNQFKFDPIPLKNFCLKKNWILRWHFSDHASVTHLHIVFLVIFEYVSVATFESSNTCWKSTLKILDQCLWSFISAWLWTVIGLLW